MPDKLVEADLYSRAAEYSFQQFPIHISTEDLDHIDRKAAVLNALDDMAYQAATWDAEPFAASLDSVETAKRFILALPENRVLPLISVDGDGDILLVWEPPMGNCLVTIELDTIHLVDQPGSAEVYYVDGESFSNERIPPNVLRAIPLRSSR